MTVTSPLDVQTEPEVEAESTTGEVLQDAKATDLETADPNTIAPDSAPKTTNSESLWVLSSSSGWLAGQQFPVVSGLGNNIVKIGRASHCDIIFPGTHLSREHVELRIERNHLYVKDKGSVNGTYINDTRITEGIVRAGDKLRLDIYSFEVEGPESDSAEDQAAMASGPAEKGAELQAAEETSEAIKRWVTKPTSPGNREESESEPASKLTPLYAIAGTLVAAVVGLGAYLILS